MKKIIFILLISIVGIINASALTESFYYDTKVPDMYITKVKGNQIKNGAPFLIHKKDGTIVYCIDPFNYVADSLYTGYEGYNPLFNISEEQINRMNLIAHFGYGYYHHTDLKWYGVTQYLIWQTLNLDDIYFTDTYNGNRIKKYSPEINEVNNLADGYGKLPSFVNQTYDISIENTFSLKDTNNVLSSYEIEANNDNLIVNIENNTLSVKALKEGKYTINLSKKDNTHNYELFYNKDGQNLLYPGKIKDINTSIEIIAHQGKITIQKKDYQTQSPQKGLTFENTVYGLYNKETDELIKTVNLDSKGIGVFNELPFLNYYIQEIDPLIGYQLDDKKYDIAINLNNKDVNVDVYDKIIDQNIIINKYYGNPLTNNYLKESNAKFSLYDQNKNYLKTYTTDQNGNINLTLSYGDYLLKQITSKEGYSKNNILKLSIRDTISNTYQLYDNEIMRYGTISIEKRGSDGKLLDDVIFELRAAENITGLDGYIYYYKDELIANLKSINGYVKYDHLLYGKYYLKEVKTNFQYELSKDNYYFTMDKENKQLYLINEYKKNPYVSVPNTRANDIDYVETIGILLILLGYCLGIYAYKIMIGTY